MRLWQYFHDFIFLFFPKLCLGCKQTLVAQEDYICTLCQYSLPYTHFHLDKNNRAAKKLWGRVPIEAAASYFYFITDSPTQQILYSIKYWNHPKAAHYFGKNYGLELAKSAVFKEATIIIPVPLHRKKLRKRGYNQTDYFGSGLSESMGITMDATILKRIHHSESQTQKSRYERYENSKEAFFVENPEQLKNQHILLIDDVLTTGSTLEACAHALLKVEGVKISIVTLACTK